MKKILAIFVILIMSVSSVSAKKISDNYSIKLNGEKYTLLYSIKDKETNGYLNEYFKQRETYNTWSEMIAIHHFPNAYSPIDQVKQFKGYLNSLNCPSALTFDDKKNSAIIDFVMISEHRIPVILEFNIFKFQKSNDCGSVALQYARRYSATTAFEVEAVKEQFEKDRKRMLKKIKRLNVPQVVYKEIDKCKFEGTDEPVEDIKLQNSTQTPIKDENVQETPSDEADKNTETTENESTDKPILNEENKNKSAEEEMSEIKEEAIVDKVENKNSDKEDKVQIIEDSDKQKADEIQNKSEIQENTNELDVNVKKYQKLEKEKAYKVTNTKDEYIAKPRTKKEIKERNKKLKEERLKKTKKQAKKRVEAASKKLNSN